MKQILFFAILFLPLFQYAQYTGTGSVTQGKATTTIPNLYSCQNGRIAGMGTIKASDNTEWVVPSTNNFTNVAFPFSSDLHNVCIGANYSNADQALAALTGDDIVSLDPDGEVITAYVFADNYFEMYINGIPVGKDKVPFTQFNSSIIRFRVNRPFTIAMLLVDWEENLGLGSEANGGYAYHPGDGGVVAVFMDEDHKIIDKTGADWKAQTFYTSPIKDLACPTEIGSRRLTTNCNTQDSNNGISYYGLHWQRPANVMGENFDDGSWPNATTFTNAVIGVDNKPAYTNFTEIFDNAANDAQFIWSTNVILDNEVIVRHTVFPSTAVTDCKIKSEYVEVYPNPASEKLQLLFDEGLFGTDPVEISIFNHLGQRLWQHNSLPFDIDVSSLPEGNYILTIRSGKTTINKMIFIY